MRLTRRSNVESPLIKTSGETVYELVGAREDLGSSTQHSIAEIIISPQGSSVRHRHVRSEETYYVLSGRGRLEIDDQSTRVNPGDMCLILPGEHHRIINDDDSVDLVFLAVSAPPWCPEDSVFE